jgi:Tfp pilus assembly protein PilF
MPVSVGADRGLKGRAFEKREAISLVLSVTALMAVLVCSIVLVLSGSARSQAAPDLYGDGDDAITRAEDLRNAIASDPRRVDLYLDLAVLYMGSDIRNLPAAAEVLKEATAIDPGNAAAYLTLGTVEMALGHNKAALRALEKHQELTEGG